MAVLTAGTEPLDMERLLGVATQVPTTEPGRLLLSVEVPGAAEALLDFRGSFGSVDGSFVGDLETLTASGALDYSVTDIGFSFATLIDLSDPEDPFAVDRAIFAGSDTLIGSAGEDTIVLYGGDDSVVGGEGSDTAVIRDSVDNFDIAQPEPGLITLVGPGLSASLQEVEFLRFDDALIDLDAFFRTAAPTVVGPAAVPEGGPDDPGSITFRVDFASPAPADGLTVNFSLGGTATPGEDFIPPAQTVLTVAGGAQAAELTVPVIGDTVPEPDETLVFQLQAGEGYRLDPAQPSAVTATIVDDEPEALSISVTPIEAIEGTEPGEGASFAFTVSRSDADGVRSVMLGFDFGPGVEAADFADGTLPQDRTVTFAAGQTEATVVVEVAPDGLEEMDEIFSAILSNPDGGAVIDPAAGSATATIRDDDRPDVLTISSEPVTAVEGTAPEEGALFTVTVSRDNPAGERTVMLGFDFGEGVTADDFADGQLPGDRTIGFVDGQSEATITIAVAPDGLAEADETVTASLSEPDGGATIDPAAASTTLTIQDDDRVDVLAVALEPASVMEGTAPEAGGVFTVTVTRDNPMGERSVTLAFDFGEGVTAADFADGVLPADQVLNFADGEATRSLDLVLAPDAEIEADETLTVSLAEPSGNAEIDPAAGSATGTIVDDDGAPDILSIDARPARAAEGSGPGNGAVFTVTVSRSDAAGPRNVDLNFAFGSGITGADFIGGQLPADRTLSFADGDSSTTITVAVNPDTIVEADETFTVSLANPDPGGTIDPEAASSQVTIVNDDAVDRLSVDIVPSSADEGTGAGEGAVFTVLVDRSNPAGARSVSAEFAFGAGVTASDFLDGALPADRVVSFTDGQAQASFQVLIDPDDLSEADETFTVSLADPSGNAALDPDASSATATIANDDAGPDLFSIAITPPQAQEGSGEGEGAVFTVAVSRTAATEPRSVSVDFDFGAGLNDADFIGGLPLDRTLDFAIGQQTVSFATRINPDFLIEADERFTASLSNPSAGALINPSAASDSATILNDDEVQIGVDVVPVSAPEGTPPEAGAVFTVIVTRSDTEGTQTVDLDFTFGAGVDAADFVGNMLPADRTITFAVGEGSVGVDVAINPDATVEGNEVFTASLSNAGGGAGIDPAQASATILNDDVEVLSISVNPEAALEGSGSTGGGLFVFEVQRSSTSGERTVEVVFDFGAGVDGSDFSAGLPQDRTLTFADGEAVASFSVAVNPDFVPEADESFTASLENPDGAAVIDPGAGSATATILNDDNDFLSVTIDPPSAIEGTDTVSGAVYTVTVSRTNSAGPRNVDLEFMFGEGVTAEDFETQMLPGDRTVGFADGQAEASFEIAVEPDALPELDETFSVTLLNPDDGAVIDPDAGSASATIIDDDEPDILALAVDPATVIEGSETPAEVTFTITRSQPESGPRNFDLRLLSATSDADADDFGSVTSPDTTIQIDEAALAVTGVIPDGQAVATIIVTNVPDTVPEPDESADFVLTTPDTGEAEVDPANNVATVTLLDDDGDVLTLDISPSSQPEGTGNFGATYTVTVDRSNPVGPRSVDLDFFFSTGIDANDFAAEVLPAGRVVTFADGEAQQSFTIDINPDTTPEFDEIFSAELSNPSGSATVDPMFGVASATIVDDDASVFSIAVDPASQLEGSNPDLPNFFEFTVSRTNPNNSSSVNIDFIPGAGITAGDFIDNQLPQDDTLFFETGQSQSVIGIDIAADEINESDEQFTAQLSNPTNFASIDPFADMVTATILNDDGGSP